MLNKNKVGADMLKYTEQAMNLLGGEVPLMMYLPPSIRNRKVRITADGVTTTHPYSADELQKRVVEADPLGFLIAIMNGQPLPSFRLEQPKQKGTKQPRKNSISQKLDTLEDGVKVYVDYYSPSYVDRERVAKYLLLNFAPNMRPRNSSGHHKPAAPKPDENDYDTMIAKRAQQTERTEE